MHLALGIIDPFRSLERGAVLIFTHAHFLRALAVRWIELELEAARRLVVSTASLSVLGYEHSLAEPVIRLWNDDRHVLRESE